MSIKYLKKLSALDKFCTKSSLSFMILFSLLFLSCETKQKTKYEFLKTISKNINKTCPIQVDSILKLENTLALPIATFRFNYVLTYDTVKYDIHAFENTLAKTTLNTVKTSPDAKMFRDMNATLEYNYSDTMGNYLFRIVIEPGDYR